MGEQSNINWTDHTWNPWIGCTKVSDGCKNCYAERMAHHRKWAEWGAGKPRRRAAESTLKLPFRWNRRAERTGAREAVFCGSLMDVFDPEVPDEWRDQVFATIALTPWLNWALLTKRPKEAVEYLGSPMASQRVASQAGISAGGGHGLGTEEFWPGWPLPNVWIGVSVEDQKTADARLPHLMQMAAMGWQTWVSYEPALGPVDWTRIKIGHRRCQTYPDTWNALTGQQDLGHGEFDGMRDLHDGPAIQGIVVGGESGPGARPAHPDWFRTTRDQCEEAGVTFFFKQWGEWLSLEHVFNNGVNVRRKEQRDLTDGILPVRVYRVGKKAAGRLLDGREHNALPWGAP